MEYHHLGGFWAERAWFSQIRWYFELEDPRNCQIGENNIITWADSGEENCKIRDFDDTPALWIPRIADQEIEYHHLGGFWAERAWFSQIWWYFELEDPRNYQIARAVYHHLEAGGHNIRLKKDFRHCYRLLERKSGWGLGPCIYFSKKPWYNRRGIRAICVVVNEPRPELTAQRRPAPKRAARAIDVA